MIKPIREPSVWRREDLAAPEAWSYRLSTPEADKVFVALTTAERTGITLENCTALDLPLPGLAEHLAMAQQAIEEKLGFYLLRGLPADRLTVDQNRLLYWAVGLHLGTAVSQSKRGDVLGDVRDLGTGLEGPKFRGYTSAGELTYHVDAADVTALYCLHGAKQGGISRIVSSAAIHNEILASRSDLLEVLYEPYFWSWQGNERPGEVPYYTQPIFASHRGQFLCRYTRTHIRSAEMMDELPGLTDKQLAALSLIDEIAERPDFQLETEFEPGDLQVVNNHLILHMRTEFEDYPEPERRRHLLRLWLSMPNSRALPESFAPFFGDITAGAVRGGFPGHGPEQLFQTS